MYGNSRQKDFFIGALTGGIVATLTALLFTTSKGKQIQRQIINMCEEAEDVVMDIASGTKQKIADIGEEIRDTFSETASEAKKKIVESKNKAEETANHVSEKLTPSKKEKNS